MIDIIISIELGLIYLTGLWFFNHQKKKAQALQDIWDLRDLTIEIVRQKNKWR